MSNWTPLCCKVRSDASLDSLDDDDISASISSDFVNKHVDSEPILCEITEEDLYNNVLKSKALFMGYGEDLNK